MPLTYTQLVGTKDVDGSIRNWANYALLPAAAILTNAQAFIYDRLRAREMRVETPVTITSGDSFIALPDRFLDPIELRLNGDADPIQYVHENLLGRYFDRDTNVQDPGTINRYAIVDEKMKFDVPSDEDRAGFLWFYQTPIELAATDNEQNFLTKRYPQLLLDACEMGALAFRKMYAERDDALKLLLEAVNDANVSTDLGRRGQTLR